MLFNSWGYLLFLLGVLPLYGWLAGRTVAWAREIAGTKTPHARACELRDNWTNWLLPLRAPRLPGGGEL